MTILPSQAHLFDIPDDITYLNVAYMSPLMTASAEAGERGIASKIHPWTVSPADFFTCSEETRRLAGAVIGADAESMAIVPSVSYGTATAANCLQPGKGEEILLLEGQFPSNVYVWKDLAASTGANIRLLNRQQGEGWTEVVLEAIGSKTAIVAVPNCHWTDGALIDLVEVGKRVREVSAALVLDLSQSAGAMPISMEEVQPDFAIYPTYKWALGPYSLGFLYVAPRWRKEGKPLEQTWLGRQGSEDFAGLVNYTDAFQPGARRFDMGQRANFQLMPIAEAALRQILDWGTDNIHETLAEKNTRIIERLAPLGFRAAPDALRAGHYLGLEFPGPVPDGLVERLGEKKVYVSVRGTCLRVTQHLYNSESDVDRLLDVLNDMV